MPTVAEHGIAFYAQGCCSWHADVLAAGVKPPPVAVSGLSNVVIRQYRHPMPPPFPMCEEDVTLGFYQDRLIYIGIDNGC